MLQNLLCLWKKKTHVVFFIFHLEQLSFSPYECPGLCRHRFVKSMMFNYSYFDKSILNVYSLMSPKMFLGPAMGQRLPRLHSEMKKMIMTENG